MNGGADVDIRTGRPARSEDLRRRAPAESEKAAYRTACETDGEIRGNGALAAFVKHVENKLHERIAEILERDAASAAHLDMLRELRGQQLGAKTIINRFLKKHGPDIRE